MVIQHCYPKSAGQNVNQHNYVTMELLASQSNCSCFAANNFCPDLLLASMLAMLLQLSEVGSYTSTVLTWANSFGVDNKLHTFSTVTITLEIQFKQARKLQDAQAEKLTS